MQALSQWYYESRLSNTLHAVRTYEVDFFCHHRHIIHMGDRSFIQINFISLLIPVMGEDELDKLVCSQHTVYGSSWLSW